MEHALDSQGGVERLPTEVGDFNGFSGIQYRQSYQAQRDRAANAKPSARTVALFNHSPGGFRNGVSYNGWVRDFSKFGFDLSLNALELRLEHWIDSRRVVRAEK